MTSDAQRAANRRNALAATGPLSTAGKDRVRANALRHGLTTGAVMVLPDEDTQAFERLHAALHADLAPGDALQEQLVDRAALLLWRLARAARLETALFAWRNMVGIRQAVRSARFARDRARTPLMSEPSSAMTPQEAERDADAERGMAEALLAPAFLEDLQRDRALEHLSRYERRLERSLETTLAALARQRRAAAQERASGLVLIDGQEEEEAMP